MLARTFDETDFYRVVGNVYFDFEIVEGLSFKTQYSVYFSTYENNWFYRAIISKNIQTGR